MSFLIFLLWIMLSIIIGGVATSKGRSGIGFFFLSLVVSPLITLIILLIVKEKEDNVTTIRCPCCKGIIQKDSIICKYCGTSLSTKQKDLKEGINKYENTGSYFYDVPKNMYEWDELVNLLKNEYIEYSITDVKKEIKNSYLLMKNKSSYNQTNTPYFRVGDNKENYKIEVFKLKQPSFLEKNEIDINKNVISDNIDNNTKNVDKLIELSKLLDKGLLTEEEFLKQKDKLINQ